MFCNIIECVLFSNLKQYININYINIFTASASANPIAMIKHITMPQRHTFIFSCTISTSRCYSYIKNFTASASKKPVAMIKHIAMPQRHTISFSCTLITSFNYCTYIIAFKELKSRKMLKMKIKSDFLY